MPTLFSNSLKLHVIPSFQPEKLVVEIYHKMPKTNYDIYADN